MQGLQGIVSSTVPLTVPGKLHEIQIGCSHLRQVKAGTVTSRESMHESRFQQSVTIGSYFIVVSPD